MAVSLEVPALGATPLLMTLGAVRVHCVTACGEKWSGGNGPPSQHLPPSPQPLLPRKWVR
jgi:hypothetical protein